MSARVVATFSLVLGVLMTTEFGTKSAVTRLLQKISQKFCVERGILENELLDEVNLIVPRPSLVAMATNFETKLTITMLVQEIGLSTL